MYFFADAVRRPWTYRLPDALPHAYVQLDPNVIRIPIVPGCDPRKSYGDLVGRGVKGVVLESFGVGNMPDTAEHGWLPWLKAQRKKGLQVRIPYFI